MAAKLILDIVGDSSSAVAALGKTESATKSAGGQAKSTSSSLAGIAKAVATGYAVKKVVDFGKSSVQAAGDAAHANKVLTATMKNAGDTTGEAAGHAIDLAESWGRATGISPTVVKGAEAILATFHTVSDETGRQSGIFDRATKAAGDLAAAGFGSMDTNAKQLGKALADPTKGMTALTRSGVNFTEAQKEQIKNMQKSGDLLGAQKIVLGEVENQVKGTAESTAGSGAKMKVAYEEMKVSIGAALLPTIGKVKTEFSGLFNFISSNASWLVPVVGAIAGLVVALLAFVKVFQLFGAVRDAIVGVRAAWVALNSSFLMSPIGLIIVAIIALAAILVVLYLKVDWFRAAVNAAWAAIAAGFAIAWGVLVGLFNGAVSFLQTWGTTMLWVIAWPFMIVFSIIQAAVTGGWSGILALFASWAATIVGALSTIVNVISAPFKAAWSAIQSGLIQPLSGAFSGVVSAITGALAGVENAITAPFKAAWDFIDQHILSPLKSAWNSVANTINAIHVSFTIPSNPITDVLHVAGKGFDWSPPFHIPTLARGGLITTTGFVYAHAGEAISPIPSRITGRQGPAVQIEHAHFSEKIDVETFGRRLAWTLKTAGV